MRPLLRYFGTSARICDTCANAADVDAAAREGRQAGRGCVRGEFKLKVIIIIMNWVILRPSQNREDHSCCRLKPCERCAVTIACSIPVGLAFGGGVGSLAGGRAVAGSSGASESWHESAPRSESMGAA